MTIRISSILILLVACGGSSSPNTEHPDAPNTTKLDPAKCVALAQSMVNAASACGTPLPAGAQAMLETMCKKGVTTGEMCGGNPGGGLDCFASPDPTDWVCQLGQPYP